MLVFVDGRERPEYVPWADVARVDLDRPQAFYPPLAGRLGASEPVKALIERGARRASARSKIAQAIPVRFRRTICGVEGGASRARPTFRKPTMARARASVLGWPRSPCPRRGRRTRGGQSPASRSQPFAVDQVDSRGPRQRTRQLSWRFKTVASRRIQSTDGAVLRPVDEAVVAPTVLQMLETLARTISSSKENVTGELPSTSLPPPVGDRASCRSRAKEQSSGRRRARGRRGRETAGPSGGSAWR